MDSKLSPSPTEILEEKISDVKLTSDNNRKQIPIILDLCELAVPAVLNAAAGGNVICKSVALQILKLLNKLK